MTYEFIVPFLEASSFLNLHDADVLHLGINEDVLLLGASFDLQPCDLLKIIHDKSNKLNRNKVMELLNEGVTSISYLSNFYRLRHLGFSIREICILAYGSIPVECVQRYGLSQLYKALGFSISQINFFNQKPDWLIQENFCYHPEQIFPYIKNGISVDDWYEIQWFIKHGITPIQAIPFREIGCKHVHILHYLNAGFSAEQVSPYLEAGIHFFEVSHYFNAGVSAEQVSPYLNLEADLHLEARIDFSEILHYLINGFSAEQVSWYLKAGINSEPIYVMDYIEYGITPFQAVSFRDVTVSCISGKRISIFLYFGVSPQQLSSYIESGIEIWCEPFVKIFMTNGYTFTEYLRAKQILSYLDTMSKVCLSFIGILLLMFFCVKIELYSNSMNFFIVFLIKYVLPILIVPIFTHSIIVFYLNQLFFKSEQMFSILYDQAICKT